MIIKLKLQNYNGARPIETYNSVKDAERYLNEVLYYRFSAVYGTGN